MNNHSGAYIVSSSDKGTQVCAAAARISTTPGTALSALEKSRDVQKDRALVMKVMSSGHKSVVEHHVLTIAFEDVSVLVEQFLIEFRLASFTVKSRRYVDFSHAGYYVPDNISDPDGFCAHVKSLFDAYESLTELGIPREDARFVLPYCFLSNFYVTCNVRELLNIIGAMRQGRGCAFAELRALGAQLATQLEDLYPGITSAKRCNERPLPHFSGRLEAPHVAAANALLVGSPENCAALLEAATAFSGRFVPGEWDALVRDARPRELECLSFTYRVCDASLSCVTHFARHRIQSPIFASAMQALERGGYVLPETVAAHSEAARIYREAFERNHAFAQSLVKAGSGTEILSYLALSGNVCDIFLSMNARELLHFFKLRTCNRAQWEIRAIAWQMLALAREKFPALFCHFGPSCAVDGHCPEGRLSCGKPYR